MSGLIRIVLVASPAPIFTEIDTEMWINVLSNPSEAEFRFFPAKRVGFDNPFYGHASLEHRGDVV